MSQLIDDTVTELIGSTSASAYVPHEWDCDELITAEALNRIEQGIANAGGGQFERITMTKELVEGCVKFTLDKTAAELREMFYQGKQIIVEREGAYYFPTQMYFYGEALNATMLRSAPTVASLTVFDTYYENGIENAAPIKLSANGWEDYLSVTYCSAT